TTANYSAANNPTTISNPPATEETTTQDSFNYPLRRKKPKFGEPYESAPDTSSPDSENPEV
ncbi:hypothetical protein, partial [Brunnivagina elsteri]